MRKDGKSKMQRNASGATGKRTVKKVASKDVLRPHRSIISIDPDGPAELDVNLITPIRVGLKAYGLASMPIEWVPPFVVVSSSCFHGELHDLRINQLITEGLARAGLAETERVIVRSSGSSEGMGNRGQFVSRHCLLDDVVSTIKELMLALPSGNTAALHWIVQQSISTHQLGHLSNERRLRKEHRDWILEVETFKNRGGHTVPFAIRYWRDGMEPKSLDLSCTSDLEISRKLRRVAMWAMQFATRLHFEWVWDGRRIWIVQAQAEEGISGKDPYSLIPLHLPPVDVASLKVFRLANEKDYKTYGKLRNAHLYAELGYQMPHFYVLDDDREIASVLAGRLSDNLKADVAELTKRPLILRTDGQSIPKEKREMLPRSDVLSSAESATRWLGNQFRSKIKESNLDEARLCLLAHHFIPSVASAWAGAEPGNRIVRIESLWGIPEGLYWHSHDTFEVDTMNVAISDARESPGYEIHERLRYKGTFIAPDDKGNWIPYQTLPPFDWIPSIRRKKWITEISRTTRLVAERVGHPISLMWFLGNHPEATVHEVLPWFHSRSEVLSHIKAAPRRKFSSSTDSTVRTTDDWAKLQVALATGTKIERVIVEPNDAELIRNPRFAEELARLAASKKFVVELSGGILSHVFYILRREGAQVECKDLFGDEEDIVEYDKLVRDEIPTMIEQRGESADTVKLEGKALIDALQQKLVEEAFEAKDARSIDELIGELADIQEVIKGLIDTLKVSEDEIKRVQEKKRQKRGGFSKGTMLLQTASPHSIQRQREPQKPTLNLTPQSSDQRVISDPDEIPFKRPYRRPDLRQVAEQLEKMFTFETELNAIGNRRLEAPLKQTLSFSLPIGDEKLNMTLTVELVRSGSSLRGVLRLRSGALQLPIEFPIDKKQLKIPFPQS
jgi:predicted house-cleaning noncanonical NTP pyrophosphatase (MazG superfamily)